VGDGCRIAANAVVLSEVPENATAVGVPARVVRIAGEKPDFAGNVDQIHLFDPVQKEMQAMSSRLDWLERYLDEQHILNLEEEEKRKENHHEAV
jgi:serine O-acetyltransferase